MSREVLPLERITQLAGGNVSGELICASDAVEVHVYFQHGRIAWATDSTKPLAFTGHLLKSAGIDVEIFREILESCRREKRPLGQTLISWGVATHEEVRDSLRHQINLAMKQLESIGPIDMLFLNRPSQFASYDVQLTFTVDEVLPRGQVTPRPQRRSSSRLAAVRVDAPPPSVATRLRASLDSVAWVEVLEGTNLVESVPGPLATSRIPAPLLQGTTLDGAEVVALRMSTTTLAGVALSPTKSMWCLATAGVTVGEVVATLGTFTTNDIAPVSASALAPVGPRWSFGDGDEAAFATLSALIEQGPEVHAIFVTEPVRPSATFGVGRTSIPPEQLVAIVERRAHALALGDVLDEAQASTNDVDGEVSTRRSMTTEATCCLFAVEIVTSPSIRRFVWLALDRRCSKGIGWGYLTSLSRDLARVFRGGFPRGQHG
jgi:hypothetical protein